MVLYVRFFWGICLSKRLIMGDCIQNIYPDCDLKRWECMPTTVLADADNYYTKPEIDDIIASIDVPSGLPEAVSALTEEVTIISGDVTTLSGDVITLSGDVTTLSGDVITNTNNITTVSGDVQSLSGDVGTLSGDVGTLSGIVTAHTSNTTIHVTQADKDRWDAGTDLSDYWTSAQTQSAINAATSGKADTSTVETLSGEVQTISSQTEGKADTTALTAHVNDATVHVTQADKDRWNAGTDLSDYWTSAQTQSAIDAAVSGKANTSTVETLSGEVQTISSQTEGKADTTALTAHTSDATIHVTAQDKTNWNGKLDASALTPYWTSAQTQSAITQATSGKADTSTVETLSGQVTANTASIATKANAADLTAHINDTTVHVTSADKSNWNGKATTASVQAVDAKFGGMQLLKLTVSEYEALTVKDPNILYVVVSD